MPRSHRFEDRLAGQGPTRPLVLLSIDDDELRARFAYELTASDFDVTVTHVASGSFAARRPDIIVAVLDIQRGAARLAARLSHGNGARPVPVVALAPDVSDVTRDVARREGCVAVCLTTCTGATLAIGLRAVLSRTNPFPWSTS
jgi:hypothetical protein